MERREALWAFARRPWRCIGTAARHGRSLLPGAAAFGRAGPM